MTQLNITTINGEAKIVEAQDGYLMMDALRDAGLVDGTCGGVASCGTCHIYFQTKDIAGECTEDEGYMLEGLKDFVKVKDGSRLSCQIKVSPNHEGVAIEIAPEA